MSSILISRTIVILTLFLSGTAWAGIGEGREQPVRAVVDGVSVSGYGSTYVLDQPPDLVPPLATLQEGNTAKPLKMRLKKSWEISENHLGANPARLPRTEKMDRWQAPLVPIHLIDNDSDTYWSSRGQIRPDVQPEWIRLDLPVETTIQSINLVRRYHPGAINDDLTTNPEQRRGLINGNGLPRKLEIRVSRDGWHWETVYETDWLKIGRDDHTILEFSFAPRSVKQIWIVGKVFPMVDLFIYQPSYAFSLAEVQAIDTSGTNVALASRGTGIQVSSVADAYADSRYIHDDLWATAWDLGFKWMRVSAWDSVLQWSYVEREKKGEYTIDPKADQAITDAVNNGIHVILALAYSNWLYTDQGQRPYTRDQRAPWRMGLNDFTDIGEKAPLPDETPERMKAWLRWVGHMAKHFKDRIDIYYIWNEPYASIPYGFDNNAPRFTEFFKKTTAAIKAADPGAKLSWPTATYDFFDACIDAGIGPYIEFGGLQPRDETTRRRWTDKGWKPSPGIYWEFWSPAPYPSVPEHRNPWPGQPPQSELKKAKHTAHTIAGTISAGGYVLVTEWFNTYNPIFDVGLFRNTFSAWPFSPTQPQPAYYVYRNMATMMDGVEPASLNIQTTPAASLMTYRRFGKPFAAFWVQGTDEDIPPAQVVTVSFPGIEATQARAYDSMNGVEQALQFTIEAGATRIDGLLLHDWPVFIELDD